MPFAVCSVKNSMKKNLKLNKTFVIIAIIGIVLDIVSKEIIAATMTINQSIDVLGSFFRLSFLYNSGVAFGYFQNNPQILLVVSFLVMIGIVFFFRSTIFTTEIPSKTLLVAVSFIVSGAFGNILDRIRFGEVRDFLDFDFPDFIMERFAVFNVADSLICVGIALILYYSFFIEPKLKQRTGGAA